MFNNDMSILETPHELMNLTRYMNSWNYLGFVEFEMKFDGFDGIDGNQYYAFFYKEYNKNNITETSFEQDMLDKHKNSVILMCGVEETYLSRIAKNRFPKTLDDLNFLQYIQTTR